MFTVAERDRMLDLLLRHAGADPDVTAAALVGSAARRATDAWSDVDLALRLRPGVEPAAAAVAWTEWVRSLTSVVDHLDLWSGPALYRVLLLDDSLQVDLSFWPADDFASTGEPFELVFGTAAPRSTPPPGSATDADDGFRADVGWAWLYALHVRAALARGRWWQAVEMVDGLRGRIVALACRRHGLPTHHGRGVDQLPPDVLTGLAATLVAEPTRDGLLPAFRGSTALLLAEVQHVDAALADRLAGPLAILVSSVGTPPAGRVVGGMR